MSRRASGTSAPSRPASGADAAGADEALVAALTVAVESSVRDLRRSVRKTLVLVCTALVTVMTGARSGAGRLSLAALYRVLPVDVVVYDDPTCAERWSLVAPCWTCAAWTPAQVVQLYGRRMQVGQSFRDFETHLAEGGRVDPPA